MVFILKNNEHSPKNRLTECVTPLLNNSKLVFLLSGDSPASEFYVSTFQNPRSVPSS